MSFVEEYGWDKAGYDWGAKQDKFELKLWSSPWLSLNKEEAKKLGIPLLSWSRELI